MPVMVWIPLFSVVAACLINPATLSALTVGLARGLLLCEPVGCILQPVALLDEIGHERLALGVHRRWITRHRNSPVSGVRPRRVILPGSTDEARLCGRRLQATGPPRSPLVPEF